MAVEVDAEDEEVEEAGALRISRRRLIFGSDEAEEDDDG